MLLSFLLPFAKNYGGCSIEDSDDAELGENSSTFVSGIKKAVAAKTTADDALLEAVKAGLEKTPRRRF